LPPIKIAEYVGNSAALTDDDAFKSSDIFNTKASADAYATLPNFIQQIRATTIALPIQHYPPTDVRIAASDLVRALIK
jgi:hypothetical protein